MLSESSINTTAPGSSVRFRVSVTWAIINIAKAISPTRMAASVSRYVGETRRPWRRYSTTTKTTAAAANSKVAQGGQGQALSMPQTVPSPAAAGIPSRRSIQSGRLWVMEVVRGCVNYYVARLYWLEEVVSRLRCRNYAYPNFHPNKMSASSNPNTQYSKTTCKPLSERAKLPTVARSRSCQTV